MVNICAAVVIQKDEKRIVLSSPETATQVWLESDNDGGTTSFTVYRDSPFRGRDELFYAYVVDNGFDLKVNDKELPIENLNYGEFYRADERKMRLSTNRMIGTYEMQEVFYDMDTGKVKRTIVTNETEAKAYDADGNLTHHVSEP